MQMRMNFDSMEKQLMDALRMNSLILSELSARYAGEPMPETPPMGEMPYVSTESDVLRVVSDMADLMQEQFRVLVLNNKHGVLEQRVVYQGTVNSIGIRVAEILRPAIVRCAPAIILVHNHPSGDPTPSPQDVSATRKIKAACDLMDVELLDHIVVGHDGTFVGMRANGLGF